MGPPSLRAARPENPEAGPINSNDSGAGPIDCHDRSDPGIDRNRV